MVDLNKKIPLTAIDGLISIDAELRKNVCLIGDRRLEEAQLFYSSNTNPGQLISFENRLKQRGINLTKNQVSPEEIHQIYRKFTDSVKTDTQITVKQLFELAAKRNASDIHLLTTENLGTIVKFRINGELLVQRELNRTFDEGVTLITSIANSMATGGNKEIYQQSEFFNARINSSEFLPESINALRINISPVDDGSAGGILAVMRLQYKVSAFGTFESIGFNLDQINSLKYLQSLPSGIVIFTGPTGSGKTTSIAVAIDGILKNCDYKKNCLTLEDPPEIIVPGVIPIQINVGTTAEERDAALKKAVSNMMRQDPDIGMIGEIRDKATADAAFEMSMTGHYIMATLHTNSALAAIHRLRELGVPPYLLHDHKILTGIIAQRLVPTLCESCKKPLCDNTNSIAPSELRRFQKVGTISNMYIKGDGCDKCARGYSGRTVIAEVLINDARLMQLMSQNKSQEAYDYLKGSKGFKSLADSAIEKIDKGILDPRDAENTIGPLTMELVDRDGQIDHQEIKEMVDD